MNIKEIREFYGLTQDQLANITGIPVRTIGNWETGSRHPADYMPDLIQAMIEQKKDHMGTFNLGLAKVRARERAEGALADYLVYFRKNGIDWNDESNPYVQNYYELSDMNLRIDKCRTEDDINAVIGRISTLHEQVLSKEQKIDLFRKECAATKKLPSQKLWEYYKMFDKYRKEKKEEGSQSGSIRSLLAKDLSISTAQVSKLQNIDHNAIVLVKETVANGDISIHTANEIAKLSKQQQEELAAGDLSKVTPKDIEIHRGQ